MVHWPKTVGGNLVVFVIGALAVAILIPLAIALSGPYIWASLVIITLTVAVATIWHRRVLAARDLAHVGAPSFGDVLRARNAAEARQG